jgi:uncharacterized protein DUF4082
MKRVLARCILSLSVAFSFLGLLPTAGHTAGINFGSVSQSFSDELDRNVGWGFTVNQTLTVNRLGFADFGFDGLAQAHDVGLYTSSGTLLVSGTVAAGTNSPADGNFRWVNVAPTVLNAGSTYVIGAFLAGNGDEWAWDAGKLGIHLINLSIDPRITISGTARYNCCSETSLKFPASQIDDSRTMFVGPNFDTVATTPIPAALPLFAAGLGIIGWAARRRKRLRFAA